MLGVALDFENYPSTETPINSTNLNNMQKLLVDLIYPVGIYVEISDIDFDPNTSWGGTWVLENDGTVLVSKSSTTGSKFNDDIGTIVGEEEHTLTIDEMPNHLIQTASQGNSADGYLGRGGYNSDGNINLGGQSQSHNNVQPSKIVNRWHRTA